MNVNGKFIRTHSNLELAIAVYAKLTEFGYFFWDDCNFIENSKWGEYVEGIRVREDGSLEWCFTGHKMIAWLKNYEEIPLDELFAAKKCIETIEIGGRKYSKADFENRLKDLEEVS